MQESLHTASHSHFYFHSHFHFRAHFLFNIDVDSHSNAPFKPPCYLHSLCMSLGAPCQPFDRRRSTTTASGTCALHIWPAGGLEDFLESFFRQLFLGPPLGRPAWLSAQEMEKKIAAKMLLKSVDILFKLVPGGSKPLGSWRPPQKKQEPQTTQTKTARTCQVPKSLGPHRNFF